MDLEAQQQIIQQLLTFNAVNIALNQENNQLKQQIHGMMQELNKYQTFMAQLHSSQDVVLCDGCYNNNSSFVSTLIQNGVSIKSTEGGMKNKGKKRKTKKHKSKKKRKRKTKSH